MSLYGRYLMNTLLGNGLPLTLVKAKGVQIRFRPHVFRYKIRMKYEFV